MKRKLDDEKKTIASNFLSLTILQIANYLLPLLVLPFLVRVLGSEKFGLVMFAQSLATFFLIVVDFGFTISGTREISLNRTDKQGMSQIFSTIIFVKTALFIIGFLILVLLVESIPRFKQDAIVYYLSFGLVLGHAVFPVWFFQGIEKMKFVTLINILAKLIFTILIFAIIRSESDYILVPAFNGMGHVVAGVLGLIISLKNVDLVIPEKRMVKKMINDSSILFVGKLATNLYTTCNVLILGLFAGNTIVGVYASMEKLILAVKNMYSPLYQAVFPWLSKQLPNKRIAVLKKMIPFIFGFGALITAIILSSGDFILDIIYNDALINSYVHIFHILSLIALFAGLNMLFTNLFFPAIKMYKTRMIVFTIGGCFNLLLSLILVNFYGIYGMAVAVTTTELFILILGIYFYKKYINQAKNSIGVQ